MSSLSSSLQSIWVEVEGWEMHARCGRSSSSADLLPIVLVHGLGVSSRYMIPLALALAPEIDVYAPDLPGFGKSEKPERVLSIEELADGLVRWMDRVGLDRAVFVGNSLGCEVIVELGLRHPERIGRAVLHAPTVDPGRRTAAQQMVRLAIDSLFEPIRLLPIVVYDYFVAGPRRMMRTFQYMLDHRMEERMLGLQVPALIVRGTRDPVVSQEWVEEAAALLPEGRLVVLPHVAHAINYLDPSPLCDVIMSFVQET